MPMGLLPLEAEYSPQAGAGPFNFSWTARPHNSRMLYSFKNNASGNLDKRQLFDYEVQGFYGQYYVSREFKGDSVMEYVEPAGAVATLQITAPLVASSAMSRASIVPTYTLPL